MKLRGAFAPFNFLGLFMKLQDIGNLNVAKLIEIIKNKNIKLPSRLEWLSKEKIQDVIIKNTDNSDLGDL